MLHIVTEYGGDITAGEAERKRMVKDVGELIAYLDDCGGVTLVPQVSGGNDGREATSSALSLASELEGQGVPYTVLAAPSNSTGIHELRVATPRELRNHHNKGEVVVIAGGNGEHGQMARYASAYRNAYPDAYTRMLEATELDGVYEADPRADPNARHYTRVSASVVLGSLAAFGAVDPGCLQSVLEHHLPIRAYSAANHTMLEAATEPVGTLIVPLPNIVELG